MATEKKSSFICADGKNIETLFTCWKDEKGIMLVVEGWLDVEGAYTCNR